MVKSATYPVTSSVMSESARNTARIFILTLHGGRVNREDVMVNHGMIGRMVVG
ncbi:MAG: hypothetical protein A4E42_00958 [Methanoregulaceae archaeon PtaU1.Bin222]|nr:MAG: hypothetical protein A4E42_00958 [Methanoregulaceae archaeon PtaU1.Bin222]